MEAVCTAEMLVSTYQLTWRHNPEEQTDIFIAVTSVWYVFSHIFHTSLALIYVLLQIKPEVFFFFAKRKRIKALTLQTTRNYISPMFNTLKPSGNYTYHLL